MQEHNLFSRIMRFFVTFVAVFVITFGMSYANDVYTIKYLNEDNVAIITDNPTVWTVGETEAFTLAEAVMDGYKFNGWYKENVMYTENVTGTRLTEITEEYIVANADENKVVTIYGQFYIDSVFWMTTTELAAGDEFKFQLNSVKGTFYVDWGDGTVTKYQDSNLCVHKYNKPGVYRIGLSGIATAYPNSNTATFSEDCGSYHPYVFTISKCWDTFVDVTPLKLAKIDGCLGCVFPTLADGSNPNFAGAFCGCENLQGKIPSQLFDGIHGQPVKGMFLSAFRNCSGLTGKIPDGLFGGLSGNYTEGLFTETFAACPGLTGAIPEDLFGNLGGSPQHCMFYGTFNEASGLGTNITEADKPEYMKNGYALPPRLFGELNGVPAGYMFRSTFYNCTGLTGAIPENLFMGVSGAPAPYMYFNTFAWCSGLGTNISEEDKPDYMKRGYAIPENLFGAINGAPAQSMYYGTLQDCTGLSGKIPNGLFGTFTDKPAEYMFTWTFSNCSGLTGSIPGDLFAGINGAPAHAMYNVTFNGCSGLTGPIPNKLFGTFNGVPAEGMFSRTFDGCSGLTGSIPDDLFNGISGPIVRTSFNKTFQNCSNLTGEIPENLFAGITGNSYWGFYNTFNGATKLGLKEDGSSSPIPAGLFKNISGDVNSANQMFNGTFANTGYLTSYVPVDLFKNVNGFLSDNQTGTRLSSYTAGGMTNIFDNSAVSTVCPSGMYQYLTGFEVDWSGRVACEQCPSEFPNSDEGSNVSITSCYTSCPEVEGKTLVTPEAKVYWTEDLKGTVDVCVYEDTVYTIKYLDEDGKTITTDNPTSWTIGQTETFTLTDPVIPEGYKFNGWYKENVMYTENVTGTRLTEITEEYVVANADENKVVTIYGQFYMDSVFWMTTTDLAAGDEFKFQLVNVRGTFYVDWGDGTVTKYQDSNLCVHKYNKPGVYRIGLSGTATAYPRANDASFNENCGVYYYNTFSISKCGNGTPDVTPEKLAKIEGCLGCVFPTLDDGSNPNFAVTFCGCENLQGEIPPKLFDGIHGQPAKGMFLHLFALDAGLTGKIPDGLFGDLSGNYTEGVFAETFYGCSGLTGAIPVDLFGGLGGAPQHCMFYGTFYKASGLGANITEANKPEYMKNGYALPPRLFGELNGAPARYMFIHTFNGCSGLTGAIPENLFTGVNGAPAKAMYNNTFAGCSGLGTNISEEQKPDYMKRGYAIPENLFGAINGAPADYMYTATFGDCSSLGGKIPENLFGNISGAPAQYMYNGTFYNCSGLTGSIPNKLFGTFNNIPAQYMFSKTFDGCTSLEGPIPDDLFNGITGQIADYSFNKTFQNCSSLTGEIPENLFAGITGNSYWGFYNTFNGATKLGLKEDGSSSPIPAGLFKNISGDANSTNQMFNGTFANTGYLTSYVPVDLFKNVNGFLADNQTGTRLSSYTAGGMTNIFDNSAISTVCPSGMYQYLTGFEVDWSGRVACEQCPSEFPKSDMGQNVSIPSCYTDCPEITGKTVTGGKKYWTADLVGNTETCVYDGIAYNINYELNGGVNYEGAPTSYVYGGGATIGGIPTKNSFVFISWCRDAELTDCAMPYEISAKDSGDVTLYAKWQFVCETGKWFHIGEDRMCLYRNKETEKTINFDIGGDVYYLLMSINPDLRINATSTKKLRMQQNGVIYNGHDWSVM